MGRYATPWVLLGAGAMLLGHACGGVIAADPLGSNGAWLSACATNDDCQAGYACLCQACTVACDSTATCGQVGSPAECLDVERTEFAANCERSSVPRICSRPAAKPEPTPTGCAQDEVVVGGRCVACGEELESGLLSVDEILGDSYNLQCTADSECVQFPISEGCADSCTGVAARDFATGVVNALAGSQNPSCVDAEASAACGRGFPGCFEGAKPRCLDGWCTLWHSGKTFLYGWTVDTVRGCRGNNQGAGLASCTPQDEVVTYARDPQGRCWRLNTSCIPDDFVLAQDDALCGGASERCLY